MSGSLSPEGHPPGAILVEPQLSDAAAVVNGTSERIADGEPVRAASVVRVDSSAAPDDRRLNRDLTVSVGDATSFGVMVGVGETYIPAFVLAIGLGEIFAGLITTIPLLIGSLLQLISPWGVERFRSHRRWVAVCAGLQGLCFVPLIIAACVGRISPVMAMAVTSLYWGAGLATGPAWNTWIGRVIPRPIRANFFARRSRLQQIATFAGFLLAGISLQMVGRGSEAVPMFAALFLLAGLCRLVSTGCLWLQSEPQPIPAGAGRFSFRHAAAQFTGGPTSGLLWLAVSMQAAVYISGPYFNPYMLKVLNFSYAGYAILLGTSFVAKFACLPLWGRYAHRHGAQRLMWIGSFGLIPLAGSWVFSDNYIYLVSVQVISGAAWGAYELALMLLIFETIPERDRTNVLTLYNVANSVALVLGSAVGAVVLMIGDVSKGSYLWVFGLSTCVRLICTLWLWRLPPMTTVADPSSSALVLPTPPEGPTGTTLSKRHGEDRGPHTKPRRPRVMEGAA